MNTGELDIIVDDNNIEIINKYIIVGVQITNDGVTDKELRRILAILKFAMGSLKDYSKIETSEKMYAFEIWYCRKLLGVTYLDRKRNTEIIGIIKPKSTLEASIVKSSLQHIANTILEQM